jgi:hypothetical protein
MLLQEILARAVGDDAIMNDCHVVDFTDDGDKVNEQMDFNVHLTRKLHPIVMEIFNASIIYRRKCRLLPY